MVEIQCEALNMLDMLGEQDIQNSSSSGNSTGSTVLLHNETILKGIVPKVESSE